MSVKTRIGIGAAALLALGGLGIASSTTGSAQPAKTAVVSPVRTVNAAVAEPTGTDIDNTQQGDQTTPDVAGSASARAVRVAKWVAVSPAPSVNGAVAEPTSPDTDNIQQGDQTTPDTVGAKTSDRGETSGSASGSETEASSPNDNPKGHADPPGDVQNQGGAAEQ